MESCLFIDGPALWFIIAIIILFVFFTIFISLMNTAIQKEIYELRSENRYLRKALAKSRRELYKESFISGERRNV